MALRLVKLERLFESRLPPRRWFGLAYCHTLEAVRGIAEVARGSVAGIVAAVVGKAAAGIEVVVGTVVVPAPGSTYLLPRREQIDCRPSFLCW